jgi:DNA polymerase I-like protein with 3'-5' exonuclease and polymerase domains
MRIMAAMSGDLKLMRLCAEADESDKLNPQKDPHAYMALRTFGHAYQEAYDRSHNDPDAKDKCKTLRDITKTTVYGLNYGSGAQTVLNGIYDRGYDGPPLTINVIKRVINTYFTEFPGIPTWRENTLKTAVANKKVVSPPIQSGAADIMNLRVWELYKGLKDIDASAFLIAQVHDAVYVECAEAKAKDVARFVEDTLTVEWSLEEGGPSMPYVASAAISKNWKEAA